LVARDICFHCSIEHLTNTGVKSGHPKLNLTAEEKRVYGQLFRTADPDGFGAVSGDVAVTFFDKTKLSSEALGQVRTAISRCA
jgi:hypothetical protein